MAAINIPSMKLITGAFIPAIDQSWIGVGKDCAGGEPSRIIEIEDRIHPYLAQTELLAIGYCRKKGIVLTAYSPSGHATVRSDPTIVTLAEKYKATPTQIILVWHVARGVVVVPKSANAGRQKENLTLPTLSAEDVTSATALDRNEHVSSKIGPNGKLFGWTAEQYGW
ncbi:NADP-dependent oxidoreductase domain-containing protein [Mycena polygramma]|nr:NADP-dependent oxidoreductase domain-containing protein [Mycena polygramma]